MVSPNIVGLGAGEYDVYVRDGYGCTFFTSIEIIEPEAFVINAGDDFTISLEIGSVDYDCASTTRERSIMTGPQSHDTTLTCLDCPNPVITPVLTTSYQVTAIDEMGCESMDYLTVFVYKERRTICAHPPLHPMMIPIMISCRYMAKQVQKSNSSRYLTDGENWSIRKVTSWSMIPLVGMDYQGVTDGSGRICLVCRSGIFRW